MSLKGEPASAHILPRHFNLLLSSLGCARKTAKQPVYPVLLRRLTRWCAFYLLSQDHPCSLEYVLTLRDLDTCRLLARGREAPELGAKA